MAVEGSISNIPDIGMHATTPLAPTRLGKWRFGCANGQDDHLVHRKDSNETFRIIWQDFPSWETWQSNSCTRRAARMAPPLSNVPESFTERKTATQECEHVCRALYNVSWLQWKLCSLIAAHASSNGFSCRHE